MTDSAIAKLIARDPYLKPFEAVLMRRASKIVRCRQRLCGEDRELAEFARGHEHFGLHFHEDGWVLREWAPNATALFMVGNFSGWREDSRLALTRLDTAGVWELRLPAEALKHMDLYRLRLHWPDGAGDRIPAYARRVAQDPDTLIFNAQIWRPGQPYRWRNDHHRLPPSPPLIYEVHVGMAQAEEKIGSYNEFTADIIPRVVADGYNTLQLMAIAEHPYYGSFGYQVSSFFAASSRFGTPDALKALIDTAHGAGLRVTMDLVHAHAVANEVEGLSRFDGTDYQYFHEGGPGRHPAWQSRLFDYAKPEVLHFLLSNCRFWLDEYHLDGFRFDGITSMLYRDHGLERAFSGYADYFDDGVDEDALVYLALANDLIHAHRPGSITIAEDVSGMPGLAAPRSEGGLGFDFRFAMGVPDYWIKLVKDIRDEDWPMGHLWHELNNRRPEEKTISYTESHDQALVGDQTLIFRLIGPDMYHHMCVGDNHLGVDRGMALHKMIRLITLATAGAGYLNFMGNEFGHPEWIDFPREGNLWSLAYARRQWHLADASELKYGLLGRFDREMLTLAKDFKVMGSETARLRHLHEADKIIAFERAGLMWVFNFNPVRSFTDYRIRAAPGEYRMVIDSDAPRYGGHGRLFPTQTHYTTCGHNGDDLQLYLPSRTAMVLVREKE